MGWSALEGREASTTLGTPCSVVQVPGDPGQVNPSRMHGRRDLLRTIVAHATIPEQLSILREERKRLVRGRRVRGKRVGGVLESWRHRSSEHVDRHRPIRQERHRRLP